MPELPEVETIRQGLKKQILGKPIANIIIKKKIMFAYSQKTKLLVFPSNLLLRRVYSYTFHFFFENKNYKIFDELGEKEIGIVSSGTSSPCLKRGIGMGYVGHDYLKKGTKITIQIRNKNVPAIVTRAPFVEVQK